MNLPSLNGNWVDLVIILVLLYFVFEGLRHGFWFVLADFLSFLASLVIAIRAYSFIAGILIANFNLTSAIANALGFLLTAILAELVISFLLAKILTKLPAKVLENKYLRFLGPVPALGEGLIILSFVLVLFLSFPVKASIKKDISDSQIGGVIVRETSGIEAGLNEIFGGVIENSLTYLTVRQGSTESVPLQVEPGELAVDEKAEGEMFSLVNEERRKAGLAELLWSPEILVVARAHAKDMWERKYFSHVSPDGEDVGGRLDEVGLAYGLAGENLALAPTVNIAHSGLMASAGHRANILGPDFKKVGIGVIDNGVYGKMFVQVFTD